jgi:hypothetical protein
MLWFAVLWCFEWCCVVLCGVVWCYVLCFEWATSGLFYFIFFVFLYFTLFDLNRFALGGDGRMERCVEKHLQQRGLARYWQ